MCDVLFCFQSQWEMLSNSEKSELSPLGQNMWQCAMSYINVCWWKLHVTPPLTTYFLHTLLFSLTNYGNRKSDLDDVDLVVRGHEAEHLQDVEDLGDVEDDGGGQHRQQVGHHHAAMFVLHVGPWEEFIKVDIDTFGEYNTQGRLLLLPSLCGKLLLY